MSTANAKGIPPESDFDRLEKKVRGSNIERHFQTGGIAIAVAAVTFGAQYVYQDNREKGEDRAQLTILTNQVIELRADVRSMRSDFVRAQEFSKLESRVDQIETRVRALERVSR